MQKIAQKIWKQKIKTLTKTSLKGFNGITDRITFGKPAIHRYDALFSDGSTKTFVGKRKSGKIIIKGLRLLSGKNVRLTLLLAKNHKVLGFNKSHLRETALLSNIAPELKKYLIPIYGYYHNRFNGNRILLMKYIKEPQEITAKDYKTVFDAITDFHKEYYEQPEKAAALGVNLYGAKDYKRCKTALIAMFSELKDSNRKVFGKEQTDKITAFLQNIDVEFSPFHCTLTHNDFSPRNMFTENNRLYIYDWELACYQNPEHDLIEFIVSVMHNVSDERIFEMISYFKKALSQKTGVEISDGQYAKILRFNVLEYAGVRLTVLRLINRKFNLPFINIITHNMSRLMDLLKI